MATEKPWYKHWWVVGVFTIVGTIFVLAAVFAIYVGSLVGKIKSGVDISTLTNQPQETLATQLQGKQTATGGAVNIATADDPYTGPQNAKVTVVEFADFECPYCQEAFPIVREMETLYKDKVKFIYRDFPVEYLHPEAPKAAEAAECAHEQNKFWQMHDKLFINQDKLQIPDLKNYAQQIGLDVNRFNNCLDSGKYETEVSDDLQDGINAGVTGTPTWFVNGTKVVGVIPAADFKKLLDLSLAAVK